MPTWADADEDAFTRPGFYIGGGALFALDGFGGATGTSSAGGFNVFGGYRANRYFSVDLQFENLGQFVYTPSPDTTVSMYAITGNLKGAYSFWRLQPFAKIGVGGYRATFKNPTTDVSREIDAMMRVGTGIDFYFNRHLVVTPDFNYNFLFNGNRGLDYMSFGLTAAVRF